MNGEGKVFAVECNGNESTVLGMRIVFTTDPGSIRWVRLTALALALAVPLLGLVWFSAGRHIPSHRTRLYEEPISGVRAIRVRPGNHFSLVKEDMIITDSQTILKIMAALRTAKPYRSSHPVTRWSCRLVVSTASGESYVNILESPDQGTLVDCTTSSDVGLIFNRVQSNSMGRILEQALKWDRSNERSGAGLP